MALPQWLTKWTSRSDSPENPQTSLSDPDSWLWNALGAKPSSTGLSVSPRTAIETPAVWAAVRRISSTVATLPLFVLQENDNGKERAKDHPLYDILHTRPNPEQSSFVFRELLTAHLLLFGNFYAEIERNKAGDPIAVWPVAPWLVDVRYVGAQKVYVVNANGQNATLAPEDVLHVQGFSLNGSVGLIPVHVMRDAIGLAKATEAFGSAFFANGAAPSGVLTHPGKLTPDGAAKLRTAWAALHTGLSNAQRIAVLEQGVTWTQLSIPNDVSQFLETRKFQVEEVARLFGIPPHLIGDLDRATFSNIEQLSIEYVQHCIAPLCARIEQEFSYKLLAPGFIAEFQLQGLMRGDSAARSAYYTAMSNIGVLSINEIRALENLNPIGAEGDKRFVPLNMAPITTEVQ